MHNDEFKQKDWREQNCVLLGTLTKERIEAFSNGKLKCGEYSDEDYVVIGLLMVMMAPLSAIVGAAIAEASDSFTLRPILISAAVGALVVLLGFHAYKQGAAQICESSIGLVSKRLYQELTNSVPNDHLKLLKVQPYVWNALDLVLSN